jgi:hypothetical protein
MVTHGKMMFARQHLLVCRSCSTGGSRGSGTVAGE